MNGEPIINTILNLTLNYLGITRPERITLKADEQGDIDLGELKFVKTLSAKFESLNGTKSRLWEVQKESTYYSNMIVKN